MKTLFEELTKQEDSITNKFKAILEFEISAMKNVFETQKVEIQSLREENREMNRRINELEQYSRINELQQCSDFQCTN